MAELRYDGGDVEYVYVLVKPGEWQFIATSG